MIVLTAFDDQSRTRNLHGAERLALQVPQLGHEFDADA